MRYLVGFVLALALVASPLNVSAQPAEEDSLGSWQKPAPRPASEEMAAPAAGRDPGALVAPKDKALVVFFRPGRLPIAPAFPVYNATRNLLTFVGLNERAAIAVEPGRHTFYVVRKKNAELVRADVGAGRTYVIHTTPKYWVPGVVVVPIRRDLPQFAESAKWLHLAKVAEGYRWTSEEWTSEHQSSVNTAIAEAEAEWSRMDTEAQAARTMRVEDGRTQDEMVALGLAASTLKASAQDDEERASFEQPAPEKPALELKLDDAGVEVAPTDSWPGETSSTPEETETLLRLKRARTGFYIGGAGLGAGLLALGAGLLGVSYLCIGECPPEHPDRGFFNAGLILMAVGAAAMITSGVVYGVRKRQLRRLREAHYGTPRRAQWDLARSRLVF